MLWLAAYLPFLPLEVFSRALPLGTPMAVSTQQGGPRVLLCNQAAAVGGVRPGLGVGASYALMAGLRVQARDEPAEQAALRRLAAWAGQFTSQVSLELPQALFLEVAGSVKLFGGLGAMLERIREGLRRLGYASHLAIAPTPQGALLLARAGRQDVITDDHVLRRTLGSLPIYHLPLDERLLLTLRDMGLRNLADLLRLPHQGLRRRLGTAFMDYLERLLGHRPDPRPMFQPPPRFSAWITLPAEVEHAEALLFACKRLLLELCGYLSAQGSGAQQLDWTLRHAEAEDTRLSLGLLQAHREPDYFQDLLRERLERVELVAPVLAIRLTADNIQPLEATSGDLFITPAIAKRKDSTRLLERLRARLSNEAVHGLQLLPEHRPERAWTWCSPGNVTQSPRFGRRPLWLLPEPKPLEVRDGWPWRGGRLELEPERERIESGWWDGGDVRRDYFVARGPDGERLWIYRDLQGKNQWFLHGFWG